MKSVIPMTAEQMARKADRLREEANSLDKVNTPYWWHWFIEVCPVCKTQGQSPVRDDLGEDCNLFEKVADHRAGEHHCACGARMDSKYRHALADWNCLTEDGEPVRKAPLLADQSEETGGTFMSESEYEARNAALANP